MIKINLLPQKRAKRTQAASQTDSASKHMLLGVGALVGAGALIFLAIDMPLRNDLDKFKERNRQVQKEIAEKTQKLAGYEVMKASEADAVKKIQAINRLLDAKIVPANVLHELGLILTVRGPTMTEKMARLTESDPNKDFLRDWDPTHVWLSGFSDANGAFKLEGGAQSKEDVTQLSKRLAASVYFVDVIPAGGERVLDRDSGISYYKFTITGRVAY